MSEDRRNEKLEAMKRGYPALQFIEVVNRDELVWEGQLCPIRSIDELDSILDDLEGDRPVQITEGDNPEITHHADCNLRHGKHRLTGLIESPIQSFQVRIVDFGDNRQPEATVIESPIPIELFKHRWGATGICAYAPWEYPWSAESSSIVEFVDHSLIWLFKQIVYSQTKVWIGSETSHDTEFLFKTIKATDRCFCGSEKNYGDCHRLIQGKELYGDNWIFFEAWLSVQASRTDRLERILNHIRGLSSSKLPVKVRQAAN